MNWISHIFLILSLLLVPCMAINPSWGFVTGKNSPISDIKVSPNGEIVAATDGSLYLLNSTPQELVSKGLTAYSIDITDNSSLIAIAADQVCMLDRKGNHLWCNNELGKVRTIRIAQNASRIYVVSDVGKIYCLDRSGQILWTRVAGTPVHDMAITPTGSFVVVSSDGGRVNAFNENGGARFTREQNNAIYLFALAIGKGNYVLGGEEYGNGGKVDLFTSGGRKLWEYVTDGMIEDIAISNNGSFVAAIDKNLLLNRKGTLYYFSINRTVDQGTLLWKFPYQSPLSCFAMNEDASLLFLGSMDGNIIAMGSSGTILWKYDLGDSVTSISITPSGDHIAAGTEGGIIYLFEYPIVQSTITTSSTNIPNKNITVNILTPVPSSNSIEVTNQRNDNLISSWVYIALIGLLVGYLVVLFALPRFSQKEKK